MAMQALRDGASGGILKFILFGLLALAAGGLIFTDVGGFFRGGVTGSDVAKIGREKISIQSFDRLVRRNLAQLGITPQQAYQFGYMQEILNAEIRRRLLLKAAQDSGIVIDQQHIVKQIHSILTPALSSGLSPEEALQNLLRNQGMSEGELIYAIRTENTMNLLGQALQSGALNVNNAMARDIQVYNNETRDIRFITFMDADFKGAEQPSDAQLSELYEGTKESFANLETRSLKLLTLQSNKIKQAITIDEDVLKQTYEDHLADYTTPETRTIAQATLQSEEQAKEVYEAAQKSNLKDALIKVTGNAAAYLPAKAFDEGTIVEDIKEPVFSASSAGILEPLKTPLGWTIIALEKIEAQQVQSFDQAKNDIKTNMIEERMIDETYTLVDEIDEFFASGGSAEDAASQFGLSVESYENINAYGQDAAKQTPLSKALGNEATSALQTAFSLENAQTSPAFELENGNFAFITVSDITPKTYPAFETIKDQLKARWMSDQKAFGNKAFVSGLQETAAAKGFTAIAKENGKTLKTLRGLKRDSEAQAPLTARAISALFAIEPNIPVMVDIEGGVALAEVIAATLPTETKDDALNETKDAIVRDIQNETLALFVAKQQEKSKASINQSLLERTYAAPTESY